MILTTHWSRLEVARAFTTFTQTLQRQRNNDQLAMPYIGSLLQEQLRLRMDQLLLIMLPLPVEVVVATRTFKVVAAQVVIWLELLVSIPHFVP